ncbi:hypothetical protein [Variovorax sp. Sphag1AA]|uniref:hypothetical protein n=1 Tax=Variovorax sp. Sphag1AA TaxID=2587027 RepID=UPI00160BA0D5|nr:hypothetical protein [Variovorax sp. Sphag1AA]MBB3175685.1 hypothetical protein [Variovorax sp. Sphag1AA]
MDIEPTTATTTIPPLTDADVAALEATAPLASDANLPHGLKHTLDTYAARTKANIAEQPVRATLIAAAGGAALMMCAMRMFHSSHQGTVQ